MSLANPQASGIEIIPALHPVHLSISPSKQNTAEPLSPPPTMSYFSGSDYAGSVSENGSALTVTEDDTVTANGTITGIAVSEPSVQEVSIPVIAAPVARSVACGKCFVPVFGKNELFPTKCPCRECLGL